MKIKKAYIGPMPTHLFDPMPSVTVLYENDTEEKLFEFFPDEIMIKEEEIIGKTKQEVMQIFIQKDKKFLQN